MVKMEIKRISESEFTVIGAEWRELLVKSDINSPMMTWEWMFSWWESYRELQSPCELYVLTVYAEDKLIGIAPFYIGHEKEYFMPVRRIQFLGTGESEEHETCSELLDVIAVSDKKAEVAEAVAGYLSGDDKWDDILCRDVPSADSSVVKNILDNMYNRDRKLCTEVKSAGRCPVIKLPDSWDDYYDSLGKRTKKLLRYERGRIIKKTKSDFVVTKDIPDLVDVLGRFKDLHQQRWTRDGKSGCFASDVFTVFLDKVIERFALRGDVQFSTLMIDDNMAASFCMLRFNNSLYFYNSAVDIDKYGALSPGTVGLSYVVEDAIKSGYKEFHFFKGRAGSYKDRWTSDTVEVSNVVIRRKNIVYYAISVVDMLKNMVARIYKR
jgi:CelD/BcsL family acetyltransferase involved in cellulose biosynthesis